MQTTGTLCTPKAVATGPPGSSTITLVAELRKLTARYPLGEPLWARLLAVLDRNGRKAEALQRYDEPAKPRRTSTLERARRLPVTSPNAS